MDTKTKAVEKLARRFENDSMGNVGTTEAALLRALAAERDNWREANFKARDEWDGICQKLAAERDKLAEQVAWRPISTAPKDGSLVILYDKNLHINFGSFRRDQGFSGIKKKMWLKNDYDDYSCGFASTPLTPTHWMPLPEPPK